MKRKEFLRTIELKRSIPNLETSETSIDKFLEIYAEIVQILTEYGKANLIFEFADLLKEQEQLHSAKRAYLIAKQSDSNDSTEILFKYFDEVTDELKKRNLSVKQQKLYLEIITMLDDRRSLLNDFTRLYRQVYGALSYNIDKFIMLGMDSRRSGSRNRPFS
jgi:hypothetical protein